MLPPVGPKCGTSARVTGQWFGLSVRLRPPNHGLVSGIGNTVTSVTWKTNVSEMYSFFVPQLGSQISELQFSPGVGVDYYLWALEISGIGTLLAGINLVTTIFRVSD